MSRRKESLLSGAGERSARRRLASLLGQKPLCSTSNIRSTSEGRCVGFTGAGESCAPAPGKLFAGAGERSHSFTIEEECLGFSWHRGKLCPGTGKAVSGRRRKVSLANSHAASRRRRARLNKKAHQSLEPVIMNLTCPLCCWGYLLGLFLKKTKYLDITLAPEP